MLAMTTHSRSSQTKSASRAMLCLLVPLLMMAGLATAAACEGSKVLFQDSFDDNLCNWPCSNRGKIENGKFIIQPKEGAFTFSSILPGYFFDDADMCLKFRFAKIPPGARLSAGLLFWAQDYNNNYGIRLYSSGRLSIYREKDGKYNYLKAFPDTPAINKGEGGENLIRVKTVGNLVTVYVNGTEMHKFRAQRPGKETKIGVWVAGEKGINVVEFDEVKITNVEQ